MIRLTTEKDKSMKDEKQEIAGAQILYVEKIFLARFKNADVLFVKPGQQNEIALKPPNEFLKKLISDVNRVN